MHSTHRSCFLPWLVSVIFLAPLWAQTTSTELHGLVRDPSGAVLPGAEVTITRVDTGEARSAVTNDVGRYAFPFIEPGGYRIHVTMPGFRPHTVSGVNVQYQQRARVDITLQIGEVAEELVEVVGSATQILRTEDAAITSHLESKRIVELPVNTRNVGHLAVLAPGVTFGNRMGRADGLDGRISPPGTTVALVAHGQHGHNQTITLDGVDAKNSRYHIMQLMPSLDAIQEFEIQTAAYSAEYGLGGGLHMQISMKSGTNDFHGALYEYHRNDALDAEDYFLNFGLASGEQRKEKDRLRRHQFGVFLSGPVILPGYDGRNRTFWSFNYEGRRELNEDVATAWYPSAAMRAGNFSELLNPINPATGKLVRRPIVIYDPLTGNPFPGNIIPAQRIHSAVANVLKFVPAPQFRQADPLDFTNRAAVADIIRQNAWFIRVDHTLSENDRFFARLAFDRQRWVQPTINPHFGLRVFNDPLNFSSQWLHTFSSSFINQFRFGFHSDEDESLHSRVGQNFDTDSLGLGKFRVVTDNNRPLRGAENGIPPLLGVGFAFGDTGDGNGFNEWRSLFFSDHLSLIRGNHSLKTGFEYQRHLVDRIASNLARGRVSFSSRETGLGFASLLLGYPQWSQTPEGFPPTIPRTNRWAAYFLDDWKLTPRFTANLGIRFEYSGTPVDREGFWRTLDFQRTFTPPQGLRIPTIFPPALGETGAVPLWDSDWFLEPRLGFAYRPTENWVVRLGGGLYANFPHQNTFTILNLMPPLSGSQQFFNITDTAKRVKVEAGGESFTVTTRKFRAGTTILQLGDNLFAGRATIRPENLFAILPQRETSSHWTWSVSVQRALPWNTALTVGYVGSKTSHLPNSVSNWNQASPSPDSDVQSRRPIRFFHDPLRPEAPVRSLGNIRMLDAGANANYHGFTLHLDKRYSTAVAYGLSYTYSKALGEGSGGGNDSVDWQNPFDRRGQRGPVDHDRTHVLVGNFLYELPFGRKLKGVLGGIVSGWQLNGIVAFRSGFPIDMKQSDSIHTGSGNVRPDRIADGRLENASRARWFDPLAFRRVTCQIPSRPDLCRFGTGGLGLFREPWQRNLDLSLAKNFRIPGGPEDLRLQVRAEAFNATNTPYFGRPNSIGFTTIDSIVPDAPRMGEIRRLNAPMRVFQLALKVSW